MKTLTLRRLRKLDACGAAISDFKDIFGKKATISKVFHRLQNPEPYDKFKEEYPGWLVWPLGQEVELTMALLNEGADVNIIDKHGRTPLYWAAANNNTEVAKLLIKKNANINSIAKSDWTPLYCAVINNNTEVAIFLIEKGADVNITDEGGQTPLYWAEYFENKEIIELLKAKGAKK